ncbi:MAG TPA: hypothetical protein VK801_14925 [Caulobacteraceae bacterium]|jgi:uncharacterized protein with LGFP repeats|nr:hypothetical protein [Caulobacteraceae bacterium]
MSSSVRALLGGWLALAAAASAPPAALAQSDSQPAGAESAKACGFSIGPAAMAEWEDMGGAEGRLGCPTADETPTVVSSTGANSDVVAFGDRGAIYTVRSGPQAGKVFAITGCAWRLFFGYGGAGGWLGLPIEDAQNTPDGQTQRFEGGKVTLTRATSVCDAEPAGPASESH